MLVDGFLRGKKDGYTLVLKFFPLFFWNRAPHGTSTNSDQPLLVNFSIIKLKNGKNGNNLQKEILAH